MHFTEKKVSFVTSLIDRIINPIQTKMSGVLGSALGIGVPALSDEAVVLLSILGDERRLLLEKPPQGTNAQSGGKGPFDYALFSLTEFRFSVLPNAICPSNPAQAQAAEELSGRGLIGRIPMTTDDEREALYARLNVVANAHFSSSPRATRFSMRDQLALRQLARCEFSFITKLGYQALDFYRPKLPGIGCYLEYREWSEQISHSERHKEGRSRPVVPAMAPQEQSEMLNSLLWRA
jgi:hypothetical protein